VSTPHEAYVGHLVDLAMDEEPSTLLDIAVAALEVRADLESDDAAKWDAWKSLARKAAELRDLAAKLEASS
jgi:hypothetical protein